MKNYRKKLLILIHHVSPKTEFLEVSAFFKGFENYISKLSKICLTKNENKNKYSSSFERKIQQRTFSLTSFEYFIYPEQEKMCYKFWFYFI